MLDFHTTACPSQFRFSHVFPGVEALALVAILPSETVKREYILSSSFFSVAAAVCVKTGWEIWKQKWREKAFKKRFQKDSRSEREGVELSKNDEVLKG